jgi:hypothetical protein
LAIVSLLACSLNNVSLISLIQDRVNIWNTEMIPIPILNGGYNFGKEEEGE